MDWVHCNHCFTQPGEVERKKFFITNCGHIYCNECLQNNKLNECHICHITFTTIPLTANMSPEVEIYFHDPVTSLKKQVKILEFQQSHRVRLVSHNTERIKNYQSLKKENYNMSQELRMCKEENVSLREEIKRMKADLYEYKRRFEMSQKDDMRSSQRTPQIGSFSQFSTKEVRRTPSQPSTNGFRINDDSAEGNFHLGSKRPSNSEYFLLTEAKSAGKDNKNFTPPNFPRFPGNYRSQKKSTPDMGTPPTPDSIIKEIGQKYLLERKVKLPSTNPSPTMRLGLHGITLARRTSTPIKENSNKYFKYFK